MSRKTKAIRLSFFVILILVVVALAFWLTQFVTNDTYSQKLIQEFGYLGVLIISFIAGLNLFIPVPAATFVPVFTAGGMNLFTIITLLVTGTMLANLLSYGIGRYGSGITKTHYPKIQEKLLTLYHNQKKYAPYLIFGFTALMPLPDEVFLIPLGIIGIQFRSIIVPLLLGTIFYQTFAALGVDNIFKYLLT